MIKPKAENYIVNTLENNSFINENENYLRHITNKKINQIQDTIKPQPGEIYYSENFVYSNDFNQAYEAYQKMDTLNEALLKLYPNILYGKAALSINDGQNEKAYELFNQVKNLPYNNNVLAQTHFWIGELAYKMARIDEAIEHLEKYISDPIEIGEITKKHAYYSLGYCYLKNNNYSNLMGF